MSTSEGFFAKMFCYRLTAIIALMITIANAKDKGNSGSSSGSSGHDNSVSNSNDKRGSNSYGSDDDGCDQLLKKDSSWIADVLKKTLYWSSSLKSQQTPTCQCPSKGGIDNVTRIKTKTFSYTICTGCPGNEVVATNVKFCTDSYESSLYGLNCKKPIGPCSGMTVYRCSCQQSTTKAPTVSTQAPVTTGAPSSVKPTGYVTPTPMAPTVGTPTPVVPTVGTPSPVPTVGTPSPVPTVGTPSPVPTVGTPTPIAESPPPLEATTTGYWR